MEYLTPIEVAELLRVDAATVRRWCQAGRLRAVRLPSGAYRIPSEELAKIEATAGASHAH